MAIGNSSRVLFGTPESSKAVVQRAESGRLCSEPGCATVLSTYNRSLTCYLHTHPTYRHPLHRD